MIPVTNSEGPQMLKRKAALFLNFESFKIAEVYELAPLHSAQ
jgi:hypothetical protein